MYLKCNLQMSLSQDPGINIEYIFSPATVKKRSKLLVSYARKWLFRLHTWTELPTIAQLYLVLFYFICKDHGHIFTFRLPI